MKSFIDFFTDARAVGTPIIAVRTFDPTSTIQAIQQSIKTQEGEALTPFLSWDAIRGLRGLDDFAEKEVAHVLKEANTEGAATVDLPTCLGVLEEAREDVIAFIHNPQLTWDTDKKNIQAVANLRNSYKANGNVLVLLIGIGDDIPTELRQDTLVLEQPLPTRDDLAKIVRDTFQYAFNANEKDYKKCKDGATDTVVKHATDALIGLPAFPAEQAVAMCLDKKSGTIDIDTLWSRKRDIVSQNPGLTYHSGKETLADMYGVDSVKKFGIQLMTGKYSPTLILRMDEIEKQFAGNGTDSSGTKGNLMGEFLTWVNDHNVICSLFLGVPGSSKSWSAYCLGGEYGKPIINYSVSGMEHEHVGMSAKHMRNANKTLDSISDGRIWLIATANSLRGLPPELISRFQVGGIFFFDAPDSDEKDGIMKLKIAKYKLDAKQAVPDMTGWTGRDIENCARKADLLNLSLVEAGDYVVPLMTSHSEDMDALRQSASTRFLSASKPGVYQYTAPVKKHTPTTTVTDGRKFRE